MTSTCAFQISNVGNFFKQRAIKLVCDTRASVWQSQSRDEAASGSLDCFQGIINTPLYGCFVTRFGPQFDSNADIREAKIVFERLDDAAEEVQSSREFCTVRQTAALRVAVVKQLNAAVQGLAAAPPDQRN